MAVTALQRILSVRPAEFSRVLLLSLGWALVIAFTISGKAARDAIFLSRYDRSYLPLMVVAIAVAVAITVAALSRVSKLVTPRQLLGLAGGTVAISLMLLQSRLEGWLIPVLYVWIDLAIVILGMQFWLLASELFDSRQAKRVFGLIAAGGSLAAIVVGSQLKPFVKLYGSAGLLPLVAAFAAGTTVIAVLAGRFAPVPQPPRRRRQTNQSPKPDRYVMTIAIVICAAAIAGTLVDYQFKIVAAEQFQSESDLVGFFGMFSAATGLSSLIFQILFTGRILSQWGILAGLSLLPLGIAASSSLMLFSPFLAAAALAKFSDQTLKFTVHNAGLECLWLPVPIERRLVLKPWITGTLKSSAEGLSGLATFFLVKVVPLSLLSLLVLLACGVWLWNLVRLRGLYSCTLEKALQTRAIEPGRLILDAQDATVIRTLERSLSGSDLSGQLFALELIASMGLGHWESSLRRLLRTGPPEIKRKILEISADDAKTIPDRMIVEEIAVGGPAEEEAIRIASQRGLAVVAPILVERLNDDSPGVRAAAAGALYRLNLHKQTAKSTLLGMLQDERQAHRISAINELADLPELMPDELAAEHLASVSPAIRDAGLRVAAQRRSPMFVPLALDCLVDNRTAIAARDALLQFPAKAVLDQLSARLDENSLTTEARVAQIRMLRCLPPVEAARILCSQLAVQDPPVRRQVPDSLLTACRQAPPSQEVLRQTRMHETEWIRAAYAASESLRLLPASGDALLLSDHFANTYRQSLSGLFTLLGVRRPTVPVELCLEIVFSGDKTRLPFVLDLFDTFLPKLVRVRIEPLLEASPDERSAAARSFFPDLPSTLDDVLAGSMQSPRDWNRAIALDYTLRRQGAREYRGEWIDTPVGPITSEVLARALHHADHRMEMPSDVQENFPERGKPMFSTLEKTMIIKSVGLFSTIAAESLARVAQVADEVAYPMGAAVYREGDPGNALYIVVTGSVGMRAANKELGVLKRGDPFGEIAVLRHDPYRAEAIALEDSVLLKIDREDLFTLLQGDAEIMKGIVALLASRVVQVGELFLGLQPAASGA